MVGGYDGLDKPNPTVDKTSGGSTIRTLTYYPMAGATLAPGASAGVRIDGTLYTDRLFTGQREMAGLGVYHYGARFYSPRLGRFLSADSIVPGYANPQNLNRYSYVNNSPLMYTDPSGHSMDSGCVNREFSNCGGTDTDAGTYEPDDPSDNGGGGGGGGKPEDKPKKQEDEILLTDASNNHNYCTEYGGGIYCEMYVPSTIVGPINNAITAMQIAAFGFYATAGVLIGGLVGIIVLGAVGAYEDIVLQDMKGEFENASNDLLVISTPSDTDNYGVIVDGRNDGVNNGTLVNSPVAFITLDIFVTVLTGTTMVPTP